MRKNPPKIKYPLISVVIPAFNEENFIARTLESVNSQDYPNLEVIVADNNSADKTARIALRLGAKVIFESAPGVANARQKGFEAARGEIIATTDADTVLPRDWLARIAEKFEAKKNLAAYGGLYELNSGPRLARMFFPRGAYYFWKLEKKLGGSWSLPGANMAVRRIAFENCGGFDKKLRIGEDGELSKKLARFGRVVLDKRLVVATSGRRYRKGFLAAAYGYVPNVVSRDLFRKNYKNELPAVRKESLSPVVFAWPLVFAIAAAAIFARGAVLARAAQIGDSGADRLAWGVRRAAEYVDTGARDFRMLRPRLPGINHFPTRTYVKKPARPKKAVFNF